MEIDRTRLLNNQADRSSLNPGDHSLKNNPYAAASPLIDIPDGNKRVQLGSGVVTRILGHGGMANVYEIWNSQLEIHKAVKLMHPSAGKDCLERFQTEIKICAKLNHPNIVEIHSVGEWHGLPYIEMERLEGVTLESLLTARGPLPSTVVIATGILACRGLSFAHSHEYQLYGKNYHGVIHRDLKPSNLMLCLDGQVKIMDFGIARPLDASLHTVDGNVVGTLQYLSPEQLDGGNLDVRADLYALGELLYEALCGCQAFPEKSVTRLLNDKSKNRFKPLTDYQTHAPRALLSLIHKSMAHNRESRVNSAMEFGRGLQAAGEKLGIHDPQDVILRYMNSNDYRREQLVERKRNRALPIAVGSLVIAAIVSTILFLDSKKLQKKSIPLCVNSELPDRSVISEIPVVTVPLKQDSSVVKTVTATQIDTVPVVKPPEKQLVAKTARKQKTVTLKSPVTPVANTTPAPTSVKSVTPPPVRQFSKIETMQDELGIVELPSLLTALYTRGRYSDVLAVYNELSTEQAQVPKNAVMALRSQIGLGSSPSIGQFLSTHSVNDAEFYLAHARQGLAQGITGQVLKNIASAESAPKVLLTYDDLKRETSFLRALYATSIFKNTPDESSYKEALNKWRDLRAALASNTTHNYLQVEKEERKRMGQIYSTIKGSQ